MSQNGDILLFQTNNDGDIKVVDGVIQMSGGLDTAAYLSLFGGNEDCSGRATCPFSWWGNFSETDNAKKYVSETQFLLKELPATTGNLGRLEEAALRDLQWFLDNKIASSVTVDVTIPALNAIKFVVTINAQGMESQFEFVENWKAKGAESSTLDTVTNLPDTKPFITTDYVDGSVYITEGAGGILLNSFSSPGTTVYGAAFDGTNLITSDLITNTIYVHDGLTGSILTSFSGPDTFVLSLAFDGINLISYDIITGLIYIHDGVSASILSSFDPGHVVNAMTFDGVNLITADSNTDTIYLHDGVTAAQLDSFITPSEQITTIAYGKGRIVSSDTTTDLTYIHDGISATILSSFESMTPNIGASTYI